jgi:hypothetical protein
LLINKILHSHKKIWSYCEQTILYILICLLFSPIVENRNNLNSYDVKRENLILCTLGTIHRLFFVTRLIINKINKVQWVDFKLENVLVSLHSLKTMGLGSIIFKEWRVTWTFSYTSYKELIFIYEQDNGMYQINKFTLH